jgi:uncharacterized ion transporter superfamily protein YfcC
VETRTEYEPLDPIAKDAENDETVVAADRSEAALWVTPTILILILLLLLLLLLTWLCFYCRKAKDKSAGMVVFSAKRGNKDDRIEVQDIQDILFCSTRFRGGGGGGCFTA